MVRKSIPVDPPICIPPFRRMSAPSPPHSDPTSLLALETIDLGEVTALLVSFPAGQPANGQRLAAVSAALPMGQPSHVVLNLSAVEQVAGPFFGELLKMMKQLRSSGGSLRLCELRQPIYDVMRVTRMERLFDVYPSREAAYTNLKSAATSNAGNPASPTGG
jgi:anti-anti-sigma factor